MNNFNDVKNKINAMSMDELFEFAGGNSCYNWLCQFIVGEDILCKNRTYDNGRCQDCIMTWLKKEKCNDIETEVETMQMIKEDTL